VAALLPKADLAVLGATETKKTPAHSPHNPQIHLKGEYILQNYPVLLLVMLQDYESRATASIYFYSFYNSKTF